MDKKLKTIAILGTRGVPANYGGFETFAEELGERLINLGFDVQVYCRYYSGNKPRLKEHKGIKLIQLPAVRQKFLETPLHTLLSFFYLIFHRVDLVLLCNAANSPFIWIARLVGIPVVVNVDGIERKRAKWNWLGKLWYRLGEISSVLFANKIIADAEVIAKYYKDSFGVGSTVIAYGAKKNLVDPGEVLKKFNLQKNSYILYVSRLEPENNALGVVKAFNKINSKLPLVIVGDAPYADEYKRELHSEAEGRNIIFTGFQFGAAYKELRSNCYCYIQATEVGGTHPALVEAMAYGNCIIANDVPEHREVLLDAGTYYAKNNWDELALRLDEMLANPERVLEYQKAAEARANQEFTWEKITDQYVNLFLSFFK